MVSNYTKFVSSFFFKWGGKLIRNLYIFASKKEKISKKKPTVQDVGLEMDSVVPKTS